VNVLIQDMTPDSCFDLLARTHMGRIACSQGNQPYITPFSFVYDDHFIYGFTTIGQKIEWMRANPLVCVEIEHIVTRDEWQTVVAFGRYQELPRTLEFEELRSVAHDLLAKFPDWWEPGYAKTVHLGVDRELLPIYFRVSVDKISGHQATPHA
jgi:nitroimidazol reductase NimA-like FMN-containing flavoprotein (pyridoxamine 5'-phosphate oxidase superfamily)